MSKIKEDLLEIFKNVAPGIKKEILTDIVQCFPTKNIKNNVFPNFEMSMYHAGTEKQFEYYSRNFTNDKVKYTFKYLFNYLKKGIFITIKNNTIVCFLPFCNFDYTNKWSDKLKVPRNYVEGSIINREISDENDPKMKDRLIKFKNTVMSANNPAIVKFSKENEVRSLLKNNLSINNNTSKWYANNCIFRNTMKYYRDIEVLKLFTELCLHKLVPDSTFFVSVRDFPVLKKDGTHPYDAIYNNKSPSLGLNLSKMVPICSQSITNKFADKLIPNSDDIDNILIKEYKSPSIRPWSMKKPIAVFRGSATGCGVTSVDNKRIHLTKISEKRPDIIDAKFLTINRRLKVQPGGYCDYIEPTSINNSKEYRLSDEQQSLYKYIIDVEGYSSAFRFARTLSYGSVILKVDSDYYMWLDKMPIIGAYFEEFGGASKHFEDLEKICFLKVRTKGLIIDEDHLIKTIEFLKEHDNIAQKIAQNGLKFYISYVNKKELLNYTLNLLKGPEFRSEMKPEFHQKIHRKKEQKIIVPKVAIIVPFRDPELNGPRTKQLEYFMKYFTGRIPNSKIFIVKQSNDGRGFNRGKLLNIGYLISKQEKFDTYIFHDVDLIPSTNFCKFYSKFLKKGHVLQLGACWPRYSMNKTYLGGITSFNGTDFERIDGFPNIYEKWGSEDNELYKRVNLGRLVVDKPFCSNNDIIDLENMNLEEKLLDLKKKDDKNPIQYELNALYDSVRFLDPRPRWYGLKNVEYKVLAFTQKENINIIEVDILDNLEYNGTKFEKPEIRDQKDPKEPKDLKKDQKKEPEKKCRPVYSNIPFVEKEDFTDELVEYLDREAPLETKEIKDHKNRVILEIIDKAKQFSPDFVGYFLSGSFRMNISQNEDDVDILLVFRDLTKNEFFNVETGFVNELKKIKKSKNVISVDNAKVPIIKVGIDGYEFDILFLKYDKPINNENIIEDNILKGLGETEILTINGPRTTEILTRLVEKQYNKFSIIVRSLRLFAKRKEIYSNKIGYLGGINFAILAAFACQQWPSKTASSCLFNLIMLLSSWPWPKQIQLCKDYKQAFFIQKTHIYPWTPDKPKSNVMPIITPSIPIFNSSSNVSANTLSIMTEEFKKGASALDSLDLNKFFENIHFFTKFPFYVVFSVYIKKELGLDAEKDIIFIESRVRFLVNILEKMGMYGMRPLPSSIESVGSRSGKEHRKIYIGLNIDPEDIDKDVFNNFESVVGSFLEDLYTKTTEGSEFSIKIVSKKNL
jgi:poly(A) polymerase